MFKIGFILIKMIISKQNALVKEIRSLADKKFRDKLGVYVVEGIKPVKEAIELSLPIRNVVGTENGLKNINAQGFNVEEVSQAVFDYISEEKSPQGVLAVIFKPKNQIEKPEGHCLLLDGVSDPSNVGAIIRTAAASGFNHVYMTDDSADPYSQKAVRSSMSGIFRIKVARGAIDQLLNAIDLPLVVADMGGKDVFTDAVKCKCCLVIGNEGRGVSRAIKEKADYIVSIPMQNGVESLNAAVSAGILMYALKNN